MIINFILHFFEWFCGCVDNLTCRTCIFYYKKHEQPWSKMFGGFNWANFEACLNPNIHVENIEIKKIIENVTK